MRIHHGWIYRDKGQGITPDRIRVTIPDKGTKVFDDTAAGAQGAADYISSVIGNTWKLEECGFLGYRIFTEGELE
jgi:hypothetical protein